MMHVKPSDGAEGRVHVHRSNNNPRRGVCNYTWAGDHRGDEITAQQMVHLTAGVTHLLSV